MKLLLPVLTTLLLFSGCTHLKGVVVHDPSGQPASSAVLTIGRPDGIAVFDSHSVNERGEFDFLISSMDATNVFFYDSATDPVLTTQHVDRNMLGEKMKLHLGPPAKKETPMMVPQGGGM